jgi:phosphoribosylaminoimidazole-succinocarboxamide synthase
MATLMRDIYRDLAANIQDDRLWKRYLWEGPTESDIASWQSQGYGVYQGKIRTVLNRDGQMQMLHSDRLTAFDRHIGYVPLKGAILAAISQFWLEESAKVVPTHFIKSLGPRALLTQSLRPIKAEIVIRGYLAGSLLRAYQKGERVYCGVTIPDGLKPYERLPEPLITPTTKALAFEHDQNISAQELITAGVCTKSEWDQMAAMAHKVFSHGTRVFAEKGYLLADTKYEFGRAMNGSEPLNIKLIDEVHTPDSARIWVKSSYESRVNAGQPPEMLDKETVRGWLLAQGFSGHGQVPDVPRTLLLGLGLIYLDVAEGLLGRPLAV